MKREFGGLDVLFRNAGIVEMRDRNPLSGKLGMSQEGKSQLAKQIPGKRFGNPREIARAVVFFASDECGFSVGSKLLITRGAWAISEDPCSWVRIRR